ncbi:NAD(P)-binding protein [Mollisia scopiformis]|uniref:NAD(P)-binding protein n=1 Tax=Mollisia scopiformis TaxID=149040 RepID=A0A194XVF8_MOLSC|nr:NAD(P)-binding protein [Mollisia scopiformis]KUJ23697.1 NAD(P)-binding protein [Mollisia scopiformis]
MSTFKNIALLGSTGNLGSRILTALNKAGFTVTAIQRKDSTNTPNGPAHSLKVDLSSESELTRAFANQDVVVSALPMPRLATDKIWMNAAIAAGVKRIVPSEFSTNMDNKLSQKLPIIKDKLEIRAYVEWNSVNNGPFMLPQMWLSGWMGPNPKTKTATFHDGGNAIVGTSTLERIGEGVAASLLPENAEKTKNKAVYVYSAAVSERKIADVISKLLGGVTFEETDLSVEQITKDAFAAYEKDQSTHDMRFYIPFCFGKGYGGDYRDIAMNKELGLKEMSDGELEEMFAGTLRKQGLIQ